jgi:hypothetical protein
VSRSRVFQTQYSHYEYLVILFRVANALAIFQNMMNDILQDVIYNSIVVYIDDILIYSVTQKEHEQLVIEVLS